MHVWAGLAHSPGECGPGDVLHVVWIEKSGDSVLSKTFTDLSVNSILALKVTSAVLSLS